MQTAVAPSAPTDDCDIATLLRAGERERAFAALVERFEGKVLRLCHALLRDPMQAEEAAQESLIRIWKALDTYDGRASLSTWIYAVTRNRCMTALERRKLALSLSDQDVEAEVLKMAMPQSTEEEDGNLQMLRELIDLLPERLRRTLLLYYFEDRSIGEVAQMLGCPEGTVKTHLFRARAALTEQLRRRGLADPSSWLEAS